MKKETIARKANPFLYALPRLGTSIFIGIADFALLFLYTDVYGQDMSGFWPILVGWVMGLGKVSIAFFQFFFGWVSDHTHTKFGRRKPYLFLLSPVLSISFITQILIIIVINIYLFYILLK